VNVPFDFIVGGQTLPAGQYRVEQRFIPDVVVINSADHTRGAIVIGPGLQPVAAQKDGKLVFHRYGNTYFLTEVWGPGKYGRQIPKTRRERELAARGLPPESHHPGGLALAVQSKHHSPEGRASPNGIDGLPVFGPSVSICATNMNRWLARVM